MNIGILRIGQVDADVTASIQENLNIILPKTKCTLITEAVPIPEEAFNEKRQQYRSDIMLGRIHDFAEKNSAFDRILGVVDVDIFVPRLNFVFGQAEHPGKAALISLWRLRQEFYRRPSNIQVLIDRSTKEALHEIGHTLGLTHCLNPFCVMYFSNSIFETDRKQSLFCNKCYLKTQTTTSEPR